MAKVSGSLRDLQSLPTIWCWNASALFASLPAVQHARVNYYKAAAGTHDICIALEAHCSETIADGLLLHNHVVVDSISDTLPEATGGVIMAVKNSFLAKFVAAHRVQIVAGRILALELDSSLCRKAVVIVAIHLQPTEEQTWAQVVNTLHDYTRGLVHSTIILIGDSNMDLDVADRINTNTGVLCGKVGNRARLWTSCFPCSDWCNVVPGFTYVHKASNSLSCLDRVFVNMPIAVCQAAGLRCELLTKGTPPHGSDHHPIGVRWQVRKPKRDHGIARWMTDHPQWQITRDSWIAILDRPEECWQVRMSRLLLAFKCTADDVRHLCDEIPPGCPSLDKHLGSIALRHLMLGDFAAARKIVRRAPHWHLLSCSTFRLMEKGLSEVISKAQVALLDAQATESDSLPPPQAHSTKQVLCRLLRMWKTQQMRHTSFSVSSSDSSPGTSDQQLQLVLDHWRPVFQKEDNMDEEKALFLLAHVPPFVWPDLEITEESLIQVFKRAPHTSAGPDGITYRAMRGSTQIANILVDASQGIMSGDTVPSCVTSGFLTMKSLLSPADLRPLSLFNCPLKSILKCIGHGLGNALLQWAHLPQWAVIPTKQIHDAHLELESRCLQLSALHSRSALCLLDFQMAFPSASRTWTKRVFKAMGIPASLERLVNVLLEDSESLIQWEGQLHWAFHLKSGLLQGSPLAALQFVVALMPWLVYMQTRLSPSALFSAYMDDCWFAATSCREFAILFKGTELLRLVAGLGVHMTKTFVLLLGDTSEEAWREDLFVAMGRQGRLSRVLNIATSAKHLGHMLGSGSDWDAMPASKLLERSNILEDMRIGLARHLQLLGVVATSVTTHSLGAFVPSAGMKESWLSMAQQFSAALRARADGHVTCWAMVKRSWGFRVTSPLWRKRRCMHA
eukprot:6492264-Amphidinium_carterae.2